MGLLRTVESGIERAVGGVFGRAYRGHVSPAEMAVKLVKEMEERKAPSFSRTYVPNRYTVYLCTEDREHFRAYEGSLGQELAEHVQRHAAQSGYVLVGAPRVRFKTDSDLKRGQFGIQAEMSEAEAPILQEEAGPRYLEEEPDRSRSAAEPALRWEPSVADEEAGGAIAAVPVAPLVEGAARGAVEQGGRVPFFPTQDERVSPRPEPSPGRPAVPGFETQSIPAGVAAAMGLARQTLVLHQGGRRHEFEKGRVVLGRGRQVDFQLDDPNVSRRHAVIYWENGRLFVKDLGSTNGTLLNGRPVSAGPLSDGDVVTVGGSEIRVETG